MEATHPSSFFTEDHRHCDELWAQLEEHPTLEAWRSFDRALRRHFAMEEDVLFPAIEAAMGMHGAGPTTVMRTEHSQMRAVLEQMGRAAESGNLDEALDHGDTLLMLTQQHNAKEEGVLYPLADRATASLWTELRGKLRAFG
ncbi:MAG: hemerythrin domain-containing protein [Polyangiaceae bacterium]|nr:hemerythrin domain-containing protein [Polyangiaceae bacterium]